MTEYIIRAADWAIDINGNTLYKGCEKIVRCRDCKWLDHRNLYLCMLPDGDGGYACWLVKPDGFCAWGERREGTES